jgi:hypothetical protein
LGQDNIIGETVSSLTGENPLQATPLQRPELSEFLAGFSQEVSWPAGERTPNRVPFGTPG